jgi:hypothetical protein
MERKGEAQIEGLWAGRPCPPAHSRRRTCR